MIDAFFLNAAIITFSIQFSGFIVAAILQTEIFYDILGGINFLVLAALAVASAGGGDGGDGATITNNTIFIILFAISRGWLLLFLAWRAHDRKGDSRFDGVRNVPSRFFIFWMVQGLWVYCISTPLLLVVVSNDNGSTNSTNSSWLNILLLFGMLLSILVEIISDITKSIWVANGRIGGFCTNGLWYISRHPNYAGEISTWIFAALYSIIISLQNENENELQLSITSVILIASISPLFTIHILCNTPATGVWNAEGKNLKRYYEDKDKEIGIRYNIYRMSTPPLYPNLIELFIPYKQLPMSIKRWFYFEWKRYEYNKNDDENKKQ